MTKIARPVISAREFSRRRRELMKLMGPNSVAVLPAADEKRRNSDVWHPFRQDSDFHYLSGFGEPEAVLVLAPGRQEGEVMLFCRERDEEFERWNGELTGPERALQLYGLDQAFPIAELDLLLPELLEGRERLYYAIGNNGEFDARIIDWASAGVGERKQFGAQPGAFMQLGLLLQQLRLLKSAEEIRVMQHAADVSGAAHLAAMRLAAPGVLEYELAAEMDHVFARGGARHVAYPSIVASGPNACILHYVRNDRALAAGDLVLIDAGCEYETYAADITRTFPVDGRYSAEQAALYDLVLAAQQAAIDKVRIGNRFNDPHEEAVRVLVDGLLQLGLLEGEAGELVETEAYRPFYMHRTGHWLGLDVHDAGEYRVDGDWRPFEEGMVTTIEPGLYVPPDLKQVDEKWLGLGIRIEDDVLVGKTAPRVLTDQAPKLRAEVEAAMQSEKRKFVRI